MRTTPGALASAALLCALVVIACIPQPAAGKSTPPPGTANCQTCGLVASGLEIEFLKLEDPELSQQTGASEAEMAQRAARRRKLMHARSELQINEVLEGYCAALMKSGGGLIPGLDLMCAGLLKQHSEAIADHVYAEGPSGLSDFLCVRLARVCPKTVRKEDL